MGPTKARLTRMQEVGGATKGPGLVSPSPPIYRPAPVNFASPRYFFVDWGIYLF